jgi:hypothetical protein
VKAVAEAHGGDVSVDSSPGRGTTFFVQLPLDCRPHIEEDSMDAPAIWRQWKGNASWINEPRFGGNDATINGCFGARRNGTGLNICGASRKHFLRRVIWMDQYLFFSMSATKHCGKTPARTPKNFRMQVAIVLRFASTKFNDAHWKSAAKGRLAGRFLQTITAGATTAGLLDAHRFAVAAYTPRRCWLKRRPMTLFAEVISSGNWQSRTSTFSQMKPV